MQITVSPLSLMALNLLCEFHLKGHGNEADFMGFLHKFDYEYLREFEAEFGTARIVV